MLAEVDAERVLVVTNRLGRGGENERALNSRRSLAASWLSSCRAVRIADAEGKQRLISLQWSRWGHAVVRLTRALDRT